MSIISAAMTTSDKKITGAIPRFALGAQIPSPYKNRCFSCFYAELGKGIKIGPLT